MSDRDPPGAPPQHWSEAPKTAERLYRALLAICALLIVLDLLYSQHGHLSYESWTGFHAAFGFAAYVAIVTAAKGLRRLVMRRESYYDE